MRAVSAAFPLGIGPACFFQCRSTGGTPMRTPASIAGHPIHPMLIPLPIGLWIFSFVCDVVYVTGFGGDQWLTVAFYTMVGGVVGAMIAALPGIIDMLSLPA